MTPKRIILGLVIILGAFLLCGGGGLLAIQFIPVKKSNPPVVNEPNWDSPQTRALAERACFDCHSNQTKWPWYANIAPVSWAISHEVQEGRQKINYSDWKPKKEDESVEVILKGKMPPTKYLLFHPEARLTQTETDALIAGLKATFGSQAAEARRGNDD